MPAFRVSGTTGQAPMTSFFGAIPDKYNMLIPGHFMASSQVPDVLITANFANQLSIWNQSYGGGPNVPTLTLGGFITAPDGTTNTMQLLREVTSNSIHMAQAGIYRIVPGQVNVGGGCTEYGKLTYAGYYKYSGRRITIMMSGAPTSASSGNGDPNGLGGCQVTFDLANGVIGVAPALIGLGIGAWSDPSAEIINYGNGIYRCSLSVVVDNAFNPLQAGVVYCSTFLDNGTGSAAASISYTGDGASGVYGWRVNTMPAPSYGMTGQTAFFDDFNDIGTIDMSNTRAPGFNWYLFHDTPNVPVFPDMSPTIIQVSGSVLTLLSANLSNGLSELNSAASRSLTPPTTSVGHSFGYPAIFETRANWDYAGTGNHNNANPSFWAKTIRYDNIQPYQAVTFDPTVLTLNLPGREIDFFEAGSAVTPIAGFFVYDAAENRTSTDHLQSNETYGFTTWATNLTYAGDLHGIFYATDGNYYTAIAPSLNQPPVANPTKWQAYTGPPAAVKASYEDFHVWTTLVLPYTKGSFGVAVWFFDGVCCGQQAWSPFASKGSKRQHVADAELIRITLSGCAGAPTNLNTRWDYVKVITDKWAIT